MHLGAVIVFSGKSPTVSELREHIVSRLHLVPRYRQRLAFPPLQSGRAVWIDDPNFNIDYHVLTTALPKPGSREQLLNLSGRIYSQKLDRSKPLWQIYLVQDLEGSDFALISKTHHALVDGVGGVDLASVLFDTSAKKTKVDIPEDVWSPEKLPTKTDLVVNSIKSTVSGSLRKTNSILRSATQPTTTISQVRKTVEGLGEIAWESLNPAPPTPLNVDIGPHRRLAIREFSLTDFKTIKDALGGTVNDAVLTVVAGSLSGFFRTRGVRTEGLELRAMVPVSTRTPEQHDATGNQIIAVRGPLPMYVDDPVERFEVIKESMEHIKESKQAVGAEVLVSVENLAPPTVLAQASRLNFSTRLFNLLVTNVPGPQIPLYLLGQKLQEIYPVAFLPKRHALAVAIMSYNGKLFFGLLGDYDAIPELEDIADKISQSTLELLEAAKAQQ